MNTGIVRFSCTGGQTLLILVEGRPYAISASDLDSLLISTIEFLSGDSLRTLDGNAIRDAINILLRKNLNDLQTWDITLLPNREVGDGRKVAGVEVLKRQEVPARNRKHSRSVWMSGGSIGEKKSVSAAIQFGLPIFPAVGSGERSVSLGECDPAKGFADPFNNPLRIRNGD